MPPPAEPTYHPAAPRRPRRWRRRLLWGVAILLLLVVLAPLAVGLGPVRGLLEEKLGAALGRRVEIGSASAYWFKGVDLEDITVHSPEGFPGPLARIAKVHADLDVLGLVTGAVRARVRVVQPQVTLLRDAAGASNADGLGRRRAPEETREGESREVDVQLVVVAGSVEALDASGASLSALSALQLTAGIEPDGSARVDLQATVPGAAPDGTDTRLDVDFVRDAGRMGRFDLDVPPLRLERLARLVEDATGVAGIRGTATARGQGTVHPDGTLTGALTTEVTALGVRGSDGSRLSSHRIVCSAKLRKVNDDTDLDVDVAVGDLRFEREVDGRTEGFREADVDLEASVRFDPSGERIRIGKGSVRGGRLLDLQVREPLRIERGATTRFTGRVEARVGLERLGALRGMFPALAPLEAGTLTANLSGNGGEGGDLGAGLLIQDLRLRRSASLPHGYTEPRVVASFRMRRTPDGGARLLLTLLDSGLARLASQDAGRGVAVAVAPDGTYAVDGAFDLEVRLARLSRLLAADLQLAQGEVVDGSLQLTGTGRGTPEAMRLEASVRGRGVMFPVSWRGPATPSTFAADLLSTREGPETRVEITGLAGMGVEGSALLRRREPATAGAAASLRGEARLTLDLAQARPWLGGMLAMHPDGRMAGRLRSDLRIEDEDFGHHLVGTTQVNDLFLLVQPGFTPIREPRVTLRTDVLLAPEGGKHEARELKLAGEGLRLDLTGSTYVASPDADVDLRVGLGGEAEKLAPTLAALLGEGYEDLRGSGKLGGMLTLTGSPAEHGRALFVEADLVLGSWTTGGIAVGNLLLDAARREAAAPLAARLQATVNGGKARVDAGLTLGREAMPWTTNVKLEGVDTSRMLLDRGLGRYLAYALPAIVPADTQTPVLSGRLDADLQGSAPSLAEPALSDGLRGNGRVRMQEGEVKQSTLFGGGEDSGLGKLVTALQLAVPEAGQVLAELGKSVGFQTLVSEFEVADRVVHVKQAKLTGRRAVVDLAGTVGFDDRVALAGGVALQGGAGERLAKVVPEGRIPVAVAGTLEQPRVTPDVDVAKLLPLPGKKDDLLDKIKKKLPDLPKIPKPKLPKLPKPKLPKLPNPFK